MIRKTTGRFISFVLAAVLAVSSYVPSYAVEDLEPTLDENAEIVSNTEITVETEDDAETEVAIKTEVVADPEVTTDTKIIEKPEETLPEVLSYLGGSGEDTNQAGTKDIIAVHYADGLTFSDPDRQPTTSIEWNHEWLESDDIVVPFPDIPEGYELKSMWAVFKSSMGYRNIPESRNDETSTYTFSFSSFDSMDVEEGITVGADFTRIFDEEDPDAELEIPIRYRMEYHFPADMPKSVKGKAGEKVYFELPYPDIPEGYELNYLRCMAPSYGNMALYGRIINNGTAYLYEYVISKEDIDNGITVWPEFERIIDVVFEDGDHGHHVFNGAEKTFHLQEFFSGDVLYPSHVLFTPYYYVPDHGYDLVGLYYSPEMDESSKFYTPGQNMGTQIEEKMLSEDGKLHIYAKWAPITAQIYLSFGDYSSEYSVTYGEKLPDFSSSAYSTYYVNNDGGKIEITPGESLFDENIKYSYDSGRYYFYVYADRSPFRTVSFDTGLENANIEDKKVRTGETVAKPDVELVKEGHYLSGWYTDAAFKNLFSFGKTKITDDTTLYAKWVPVEYIVTFHSNFGKDTTAKVTYRLTEEDDEKNAVAVSAGHIFKTLSDKEGFSGWLGADDLEISAETTGKELIEKLVEKYGEPSSKVNLQFYAQWEEAGNYTVILDANLPSDAKVENLGGNLAKAAGINNGSAPFVKQLVSVDENLALTGDEYTLKGFTLSGWEYTGSNGRKVTLKPSANPRNLTDAGSEVTVKALWKKVSSYKVTYVLNGGTSGKNKTTVTYSVNEATKDGVALYNYKKTDDGSYVKKDPETDAVEVVRDGYDFAGWTVGSESYTHYGDDIYQNLTLKAEWTPKTYTLKFVDPDGETEYFAEDAASFDSSFALKNYVPEKNGFTFKGWEGTYRNKVKLFTVKNTLKLKDLDKPEGNEYVLTARFAAASYKITYNLDGGKIGSKPTTYVYGTGSSKAIPAPKKDGFDFLGWTAIVVGEQDSDTAIDPGTGRISSTIYGNIELVANWTPYTYDIKFYRADGTEYDSEGNALSSYLGLNYADSVDFTSAAMFIEAQDGFDADKSIKGFALTANARSPKYALYKKFSKLAAKSGNGAVINVYPVLSGKIQRVNYSVILMPNAKDVKESDNAEGYINNSKGVQYVTEDGVSEFAYNTTAILEKKEWKRAGYELVGFGTSPKSTVPVKSLEGLGNGKQSSVKLYAIWKGQEYTITYSSYVHVYDLFNGYKFIDEPSFKGEVTQTYNGKDVTLKTVSMEGYTFKGWYVQSDDGELYGPIKKVSKNNRKNLVLEAMFDRVEYILAFNLNGGKYHGSKPIGNCYTYYEYDMSDMLEDFYKGVSRDGYVLSGLSTSKNGKNMLELYDEDGNRQEISGLSNKTGAKVTIYPIWTKVSPKVPSAGASLAVSGEGKTTLTMTSTVGVDSKDSSLVFEYSTSPLFIFGVNSVEINSDDVDPEDPNTASTVTVDSGLKNKSYYVRVKYGVKDSTGKYVYSKYSKTVKAARPAN